ncbi:hypothetical protein L210DRAFT_3591859 [Boletus edulis BED1]|uniref:Uncharacterized protein n=1 Tax=Boletus edulis BED1 TaxID=1328754 RepID=A0AAD4B8S8_BOLED|nr:hypothetical protein L210DRAFT_3591859 [Boletus edulis BED1]
MDEIHHSYSLRAYALGIPAVVVPRSFLTVLFCFVFGLVRSLSLHGTYTQVWNGLVDNGHRKINDYSCWIGSDALAPKRDNTRARLAVQTGSKRISPKKRSTNFVEAHKAPTPQLLRYLA